MTVVVAWTVWGTAADGGTVLVETIAVSPRFVLLGAPGFLIAGPGAWTEARRHAATPRSQA